MVSWIWIPLSVLLFVLLLLLVIGWQVVTFALARHTSRAMVFQDLDLEAYKTEEASDSPAAWAASHAGDDWVQKT
ncbi:MAG: hypothetical protein GX153_02250, partial [Clostridiaceae bacterium]|nr:hypothetical protein [Clostridiaceae bacterium]